MPTGKHDTEFASAMEEDVKTEITVSKGALDNAIWWIAKNLSPDEVFDEKQLINWCESNGYIKK